MAPHSFHLSHSIIFNHGMMQPDWPTSAISVAFIMCYSVCTQGWYSDCCSIALIKSVWLHSNTPSSDEKLVYTCCGRTYTILHAESLEETVAHTLPVIHIAGTAFPATNLQAGLGVDQTDHLLHLKFQIPGWPEEVVTRVKQFETISASWAMPC